MAGRIERVTPGAGSEQALSEAIARAKSGDPLAPVTVVVPSATVGLSLRQGLAALGPFAGVSFTGLDRLVALIGEPAAVIPAGCTPLVSLTVAATRAAARAALAEAPGLLGPVAGHPSTAESLAMTYRALRPACEGDLQTLASANHRAGDVVGLVGRMRSRLAALYYDLHDLTELASSVLAPEAGSGTHSLLSDVGAVVLYLPAALSPGAVGVVTALAARVEVTVLAGRTGDGVADRSIDRLVESLAATGAFAEPSEAPGAGAAIPVPTFDVLVDAPDEDEEVRSAIRLLLEHAESGGDLGRCVITYPSAVAQGALGVAERVSRQLGEAGIPWSGPRRQRLADRPHGQLLRRLVELVMPVQAGRELERSDVIGFLANAAITADWGLTRGLTSLAPGAGGGAAGEGEAAAGSQGPAEPAGWGAVGGNVGSGGEGAAAGRAGEGAAAGPAGEGAAAGRAGDWPGTGGLELPIGAWERCSSEAGVVSGMDEWRQRLGEFAAKSRRRQCGTIADQATDLFGVVSGLFSLVREAAACTSWSQLTSWCEKALRQFIAPGEEIDELDDALADLESLDAVESLEGLPPAARLERFRESVMAVLERLSGGGGRFGVGPAVGPLPALAGLRSDLLLVLGCREGALPARRDDDPLLPERERAGSTSLAEPESGEERDRRHLVSLIVASERAVASYARIEVAAGRGRYRSRWLEHDLFAGTGTEVRSFAGALKRVEEGVVPAASQQDCELALFSNRSKSWRFGDLLSGFDPEFGRRLCVVRQESARKPGLSRFAGYLGQPSEQLWREVFSATALEGFASCPLKFFFSHLLELTALEQPERVETIEPRERGTLVHRILERFFDPVGERVGAVPRLCEAELDRLGAIAGEEMARCESEGKTGKRVNWDAARDQILRDLRTFVALEVERADEGQFVPHAVELCFGRNGAPPLVVDAAGREVKFRGQIDRVDVGPSGQVIVVDYKTGKRTSFNDVNDDPLGGGSHLQLPLYAKATLAHLANEAAGRAESPAPPGEDIAGSSQSQRQLPLLVPPPSRPVRAEYRFASAVADFGIVPVELTEALHDKFHAVLSTLVSTIDSGCFPPRPGEPRWPSGYDNCSRCDFDSVCTTDRAERWARAHEDRRIAAYTGLVDDATEAGS